MKRDLPLEAAWRDCITAASSHYENFPVASWLLPPPLRGPVAAIYLFARHADDLADEGNAPAALRLERLTAWGGWLVQLQAQPALAAPASAPAVSAQMARVLVAAIRHYRLPLAPFLRLTDAFAQDVVCKRYRDRRQLLDYCRRSANPVGELMLHLHGEATSENLADSDAICTALQLINFLQDLQQDYHETGRIYLPLDAIAAHGVSEEMIARADNHPALRGLIAGELAIAERLLRSGSALGYRLSGRFGLEIRAIVAGGLAICRRLAATPPGSRPRLARWRRAALLAEALLPQSALW